VNHLQKKIIWCSDSSDIPTGYTNQTIYILRALAAKYQTFLLGHQYNGSEKQATTPMGVEPWIQIPGNYQGGTINYYISRIRPDVVAWLCDPFAIDDGSPWIPKKRKEWVQWGNPKTIFYFPMDSDDVYAGMEETLSAVDYRVAMSKFGQAKLKKETGLDSLYIPHCVDTNLFYPLTEEQCNGIKKANHLDGKFVIGMVGRNQSRKNPQRLLYILKEFFDRHDDAYAFFHCDPYDPMQVSGGRTNMHVHCKELGLNDHAPAKPECPRCRVKFSNVPFFTGIPQNQLNNIYNMFDVHAMSTTGEGFGITTIEAMSCGIPNITTDYTTAQELLMDNGTCGIPVKWNTFINGGYNTKRVLPDEKAFLDGLEVLYSNKLLREQYGRVGREKVLKYYSLNVVLPKWLELFDEVLNKEMIRCVV